MKLNSGIKYNVNGLTTSLKAMQVETALINITNENINGFDKVGYQRKEPIISSFTEFLGPAGVSTSVDDSVGRVTQTGNPLDLSLATKGYFQIQSKDGVKLTRDGRFKLDKNGYLLALDDSKVLSNSGTPIKLTTIPENINKIVGDTKGGVSVFDPKTKKLQKMGTVGVVDSNGSLVISPEVKQGFNEYSNVALQNEFLGMLPTIRNFDANRQIFMIESTNLSKTISQLGSTS